MPEKKTSVFNKARIAVVLFVLFAAVLLYLSTRLFFYDEDIFVLNAHGNFMSDLTRAPAGKLTFLADNFFYKANPAGYHISSILLHLVITVVATHTFRTLLKFVYPEKSKINNVAYIFFFLFLLSPVHSEPLCYILGRAGLLVTLFCLLSLLFFLKANFTNRLLLAISLLFFLMALFSYEISWTFPLIILAVACYLKKKLLLRNQVVVKYMLPYFILFAVWFLCRIIFIHQQSVLPYGNAASSWHDVIRLTKNFAVLFFRNILPPFKSTPVFAGCSVVTGLLLVYFLRVSRNRKSLFSFSLLLICAWVLAFLPAVMYGINSHNSESERYIYFSSVFALMLLTIVFPILTTPRAIFFSSAILCCMYALLLFSTIDEYVKAGRFSQSYTDVLAKVSGKSGILYLINQPSQYNGALIFRAFGDEKGSSLKSWYTINDYMHRLVPDNANQVSYITVSKKAIEKEDVIGSIVFSSIDSLSSVFPEFSCNRLNGFLVNHTNHDLIPYEGGRVVGLKPPIVYIFDSAQ